MERGISQFDRYQPQREVASRGAQLATAILHPWMGTNTSKSSNVDDLKSELMMFTARSEKKKLDSQDLSTLANHEE